MILKKCKKCGKEIEGYTDKHVDTMMKQHEIWHYNKDMEKRDNGKKR
jgi:hypothetical protein